MAIKKKNTAPLDHHYEYFLKVLRDNPLASNIELTTMVNEQFKPAKFTEGQIKYWISQIPFTIEELARIAYYFYEMKRPLKQENTIYIPSKHSHYYDGLIQYINLSKGTYKSRSPEAIILVLEILHNQKNIHKNVRKKFVELKGMNKDEYKEKLIQRGRAYHSTNDSTGLFISSIAAQSSSSTSLLTSSPSSSSVSFATPSTSSPLLSATSKTLTDDVSQLPSTKSYKKNTQIRSSFLKLPNFSRQKENALSTDNQGNGYSTGTSDSFDEKQHTISENQPYFKDGRWTNHGVKCLKNYLTKYSHNYSSIAQLMKLDYSQIKRKSKYLVIEAKNEELIKLDPPEKQCSHCFKQLPVHKEFESKNGFIPKAVLEGFLEDDVFEDFDEILSYDQVVEDLMGIDMKVDDPILKDDMNEPDSTVLSTTHFYSMCKGCREEYREKTKKYRCTKKSKICRLAITAKLRDAKHNAKRKKDGLKPTPLPKRKDYRLLITVVYDKFFDTNCIGCDMPLGFNDKSNAINEPHFEHFDSDLLTFDQNQMLGFLCRGCNTTKWTYPIEEMVEFFKEIRSSKPRDAQSEDQYFIDHAASLYVSKKRASDLNQLDKKRRNSYEKKGIKMVGITANKNELQNIANKSGVFDSLTGIQGCFSSKYDIKHQLSFDKKNSFVLDEDGKTMLPCAHSVENLVVRLRVFTMIRRNEDIAKLEAWISAIKNLSQEHIDNIIGTIYKTYLTLPDLLAKTNIQPPH